MHEFASANDSLFMGASIFQSLGGNSWSLYVNGFCLYRDIIPYTYARYLIDFNSKVRFACANPGKLTVIEGEIGRERERDRCI